MFWRKKDGAIKAAVDSVINAMLERPNDFGITERTMLDTKTRYTYWISNSASEYGVWQPYELKFTGKHGRRFKRAVKDLKTHQLKSKTDSAGKGG